MEQFSDGKQAITLPAKSAGTPSATPQARGSEVNDTTAHCIPTITAAVPRARARLPPIRVTCCVWRATR